MEAKAEELAVEYVENPAKRLKETGLLFELNRKILHPFGMAITESESGTIELIECHNDDEGIVYDEEVYISASKAFSDFFSKEGEALLEARKETLGYIIQNYPDPLVKERGVELMAIHYNKGIRFTLPYDWANKTFKDWFNWTIEEFGQFHDPKQAEYIYIKAKEEGVLIKEVTVPQY